MSGAAIAAIAVGTGSVALGGLLAAEVAGHRVARAACKVLCSAGFLLLATSGDASSAFDRWMLAGLVLSAMGDVALLSARSFLAGLAAFLGAHLAYAIAFAPASRPSPWVALALGIAAGLVLRWLWPRLGRLRLPVIAYCAAISAMLWLALGLESTLVRLGAALFWLSDLAVARQKFGRDDVRNRLLGLPLYYAAQYLLAWVVRGA
jgi:uncharacterized membrane protein YhhN